MLRQTETMEYEKPETFQNSNTYYTTHSFKVNRFFIHYIDFFLEYAQNSSCSLPENTSPRCS